MLRNELAWELIPKGDREQLYSMLPKTEGVENDTNVHPLQTTYKDFITQAIREFQADLKNSCEEKKWHQDAVQVSKDRREGKWRELEEIQKEERWGLGHQEREVITVVRANEADLEDDIDGVPPEDDLEHTNTNGDYDMTTEIVGEQDAPA